MPNSPTANRRAVHRARVLETTEVAPAHYQFRLHVPALANIAQPGQFVHVLTKPNPNGWTFDPLLRRAFSIMSVEKHHKASVTVLFRVEGRGTTALGTAQPNDEIDLIGPLGKPFDTSPFGFSLEDNIGFHVKQPIPHAIVVGGGVGVPPLVFLSERLNRYGVKVKAIIGARGAAEVVGESELSRVCDAVEVTTDDGSRGHHGRVTDILSLALTAMTQGDADSAVTPIVYACGPLPMLRAVAKICELVGADCQVSLEENMPCGIGVCNGCVVRARQPFAAHKGETAGLTPLSVAEVVGDEWSPYHSYRRVCVEGPACWADEIDWDYGR